MDTIERPSWHTDDFPELRAARPWVMQEMIEAEPSLPLAMESALPAAREIATMVREAARQGEPVAVTGCGTSEHGAMAVAALLTAALRESGQAAARVASRQAFEAALDPWGGVCIAVSHDGATPATVLALEAARDAGARTAAVTAREGSAIAGAAGTVLLTPLIDRSWCHTVAYLSAILAGEAIAAALTGRQYPAVALSRYLDAASTIEGQAVALAETLSGSRVFVTCGVGADAITARELALKIEEAVRVPAVAYELETLLHGHLVAYDSRDAMLLSLTAAQNPRVTRRAAMAAAAAGRIGARVAAILSPEAANALESGATPAGRIVLPPAPDLPASTAALAGAALALQHLTLALTHLAGVNPDLIRREETAYREAANVGEAQ